jgi:hypothetical protein
LIGPENLIESTGSAYRVAVFRLRIVAALAVSALLLFGCGSGGGGNTDPNAQSKPTWTATVPHKNSPDAGPSKQAALRVALAVYAESFGPDEHSYRNQCFGSKSEASWNCIIVGKRCLSNVIITFNSPDDSTGHPYRITNDCSPPTRGFYPFYKGCRQRPGCVARAEQAHSFPRNAAIRPEGYPRPPAHGPCGSFIDPFESYWVSVSSRHTSCGTALALAHALHWRTAKTHSLDGDLFAISGFPGWTCSSGMGQSRCTKGHQQAQWGFQSIIRWAHPNNPNR